MCNKCKCESDDLCSIKDLTPISFYCEKCDLRVECLTPKKHLHPNIFCLKQY